MDVRIEYREPLLCDTGRHAGDWRVDLRGSIYLTPAELDRYQAGGGLSIALIETPAGGERA
jgi:hypothetical protein